MSEAKPYDALIIGAGGLGCPVLPLLASMGARMRVIDDDEISASNLQRQLLFRTEDVGRPKVEVAAERVGALYPGASVEGLRQRIEVDNALELVSSARIVLDGSDNFATRFLVNDACVLAGTPLVHGAILRFTGQVQVVLPGSSACYRCLFEEPPPAGSVPTCAEAGVLGALCGIVGSRMAAEARRLLGGEAPSEGIWVHDALAGRVRRLGLRRDPRCTVCGDEPLIRSLRAERYAPEVCAA